MEINSRNSSFNIDTDPVVISERKIISGNAERVRLIITNTSTGGQIISVAVDGDPSAGTGLVLSPGGSMAWEKQSVRIQQGRVIAIADGAGGTLAVYEEVAQ